MKFVIKLLFLVIFLTPAYSNEFYINALKDAAISNGFKKPSEINSTFDLEKSKLGKKFFHEELLSLNTNNSCSSCH